MAASRRDKLPSSSQGMNIQAASPCGVSTRELRSTASAPRCRSMSDDDVRAVAYAELHERLAHATASGERRLGRAQATYSLARCLTLGLRRRLHRLLGELLVAARRPDRPLSERVLAGQAGISRARWRPTGARPSTGRVGCTVPIDEDRLAVGTEAEVVAADIEVA